MKPTIKNPDVADEDLIEAMNRAMSAETERVNKFNFSGRTKPAKMGTLEMVNANAKEKKDEGRVLAALKSVQTEMATMQTEMKTLRGAITKVQETASEKQREVPRNPTHQPTRRGCAECQEKGISDTCHHCFHCGGSNHFARHYQMTKNQGNCRGLPPRDRE